MTEIRDSPTPWLTLEFNLYDFLPVAFFYDRGWGGFSVDYGSRRVSLLELTDVHFDHGRVQVAKAVDDLLTAARPANPGQVPGCSRLVCSTATDRPSGGGGCMMPDNHPSPPPLTAQEAEQFAVSSSEDVDPQIRRTAHDADR